MIVDDKGKKEIDLSAVEAECFRVSRLYSIVWFGYDPAAGGSFMAQRLRKNNVSMKEMTFSATNLTAMATSFVQVMKDGIIECYEDPENRLRRDFGKFNIEHRPPSNYKLVAISDEFGHADVGTALVIALPEATTRMEGWATMTEIFVQDDAPLTKKEISDMPPELRDIYEMDLGEDEYEDEEDLY